ncbi:MAG: HD domain-containing protein [Synergistaceae bacterium]|nr:HD domain-containing protein [Synergistaceae bacterium]MBQ7169930.1 HD domain-containing protein [Synergistaceae bacterium]
MIASLSVKDIKQLAKNSEFSAMGVVSKFIRRKDRNNSSFWEMTLSDPSGDIDGKIWQASSWRNTQGGDDFPIDPDNCGLKFEGASVKVSGVVAEFREQIQYNFTEISYLDQDEYPPKMFARHSPVKAEILEDLFRKLIDQISHAQLHDFVDAVFFKHGLWDKFKSWPAAVTLHHAYTGGLLEHSVSVAIGAMDLARHYSVFRIPVNINLVIAGSLLHDIGKLEAYTMNPAPQVTTAGTTADHIALGYAMFMKLADAESLDKDIALALGHIITSHHGKREYGSPVLPATPEAFIVSAADNVDFELAYWKSQIDALNPDNDITDYLPAIDRRLWRGIRL